MRTKETKTVVVLGMHRSGTSMISGLLSMLDVEMGEPSGLKHNESNPFGYFEDPDFVALNNDILMEAGGSWSEPPALEAILATEGNFNKRLSSLLGERTGTIWGWKDPRTCLTIDLYLPFLNNAYFIVCLRDSDKVAASLGKSESIPIEQASRLKELYDERIESFFQKHPGLKRLTLKYEDVVRQPLDQVQSIVEFLELSGNAEKMNAAAVFVQGQGALRKAANRIRLDKAKRDRRKKIVKMAESRVKSAGKLLFPHYDSENETGKARTLVITEVDPATFVYHRVFPLIDYLSNKDHEVTVLRHLSIKYCKGIRERLFSAVAESRVGKARCIAVKSIKFPVRPKISSAFFSAFTFARRNSSRFQLCIAEGPWAGLVGRWLKKFGMVEMLVYDDLDYFEGFFEGSRRKHKEIVQMVKKSLRGSDLVVCVGNELKRLRKGQTHKPIVVVPNGVKPELFNPPSWYVSGDPPPSDGTFDLVYAGSLEDWAGLEMVIQTLPKLVDEIPNVRLVILGVGRREKTLRQLTVALGMEDHILFTGRIPYEELSNYLVDAAVGIAAFKPTSAMKYAFHLKLIEYMACGLSIIGTRIGETEKIIDDSKAGLLIDYNVEEFTQAVLDLYRDPEQRAEFRKNGIQYAMNYSWESLFDRMISEIERIRNRT